MTATKLHHFFSQTRIHSDWPQTINTNDERLLASSVRQSAADRATRVTTRKRRESDEKKTRKRSDVNVGSARKACVVTLGGSFGAILSQHSQHSQRLPSCLLDTLQSSE